MIVLLDTNILLDVIQQRIPHDAAAARVWELVADGTVTGYVSAISFNNVFYVMRKQSGRDRALDAAKLLRKTFQFLRLDEDVIDRALATCGTDLEDAIQAAAAARAKADYIITRNVKDFTALGVPAINAGELLAILEP